MEELNMSTATIKVAEKATTTKVLKGKALFVESNTGSHYYAFSPSLSTSKTRGRFFCLDKTYPQHYNGAGGMFMPRNARKQSESGIFHVMLRGIDRQVIFQDDEDCEKYLQCLSDCQKVSGFTLYAYCLMGNHVHLLLQEGPEPLSQIFKRLGVRYVYWYNWKYKRTGHLFQDRFKSEPVEDDTYFLAVLRYIYQNPVKAGLCKEPEEYPWSSYFPTSPYRFLVDQEMLTAMIAPEEFSKFLKQNSEQVFLDANTDGRLNDREAAERIKALCCLNAATEFSLLSAELQGRYLSQLQQEHCSIRQLARLTGLTKGTVEKLLK